MENRLLTKAVTNLGTDRKLDKRKNKMWDAVLCTASHIFSRNDLSHIQVNSYD